jgi:hypothetical protein
VSSLLLSHARHCFDLDTKAITQRWDGNDRAVRSDGRSFGIDVVEDRPIIDIRDVDANLNELVDSAVCRLQAVVRLANA